MVEEPRVAFGEQGQVIVADPAFEERGAAPDAFDKDSRLGLQVHHQVRHRGVRAQRVVDALVERELVAGQRYAREQGILVEQEIRYRGAPEHVGLCERLDLLGALEEEEELRLTSVGVDIGSSTTHLVFSRLELTLEGSRYRVTRREVLNESEILLTPYVDETRIDVEALEAFINQQYKNARIRRDEVDTGALILTGVAVRRRNARAIAELFAEEAGKFVAVSAGDGLEATMAAHGSGAVAHSGKIGGVVLNIDIGGGTSKFAVCNNGKVQEVSAIDIGARLLAFNNDGAVARIEEAGRKHAGWAGFNVQLGQKIPQDLLRSMASGMVDKLFAMLKPESMNDDIKQLLRLPPLTYRGEIDCVMFSGGVSEFIYNREKTSFGDLGPLIADEIHHRMAEGLSGTPVQTLLRNRDHYWELMVLTQDRPRLFASLTGALTAWGMNIVAAEAFANSAGTVLDTFRFVDLFHTLDLNPAEQERLQQTIHDVLTGRKSLEELMRGRVRTESRSPAGPKIPTRIRFDDSSSSHSTLLELTTQDHPGLLYQISSILSEHRCNIEVAAIDTQGRKAIDVFYLTAEGGKLGSEDKQAVEDAPLPAL